MIEFQNSLSDFKILAAIIYIFALSITPGPNNIMLATSGVNFGFNKTLPHLLGITFGAVILVIFSSLGLGAIFIEIPSARLGLFFIGSIYLIYLAIKILKSNNIQSGENKKKPMTFFEALFFQFVNPKTWLMAANLIILFSLEGNHFFISVFYICFLLFLINYPSICLWALLGVAFQKALKNKNNLKIYNSIMALLLILCIPMLYWD